MFTHNIDPVITQVGGVYLWYYGLSYTLGFLAVLLWFHASKDRLRFTSREASEVSLLLMLGIILFGRLIEVFFYEWDYYGAHPAAIPAVWLGGMSTHGILLGATLAVIFFCILRDKTFFRVADELVIPGALIMGLGRLGNFADGLIVGSVTDMPWGVVFPDAAGARHPVVIYDGLKNLLLIPLLLWVRARGARTGVAAGLFILLYGFLRIFIDFFREYPVQGPFGLPPGQWFNMTMTVIGLAIVAWSMMFGAREPFIMKAAPQTGPTPAWQWAVVLFLLLFPLVMPSDWTQDVPVRYAKRHLGITHSAIYPEVPERRPR